jgi:hypothetical protein
MTEDHHATEARPEVDQLVVRSDRDLGDHRQNLVDATREVGDGAARKLGVVGRERAHREQLVDERIAIARRHVEEKLPERPAPERSRPDLFARSRCAVAKGLVVEGHRHPKLGRHCSQDPPHPRRSHALVQSPAHETESHPGLKYSPTHWTQRLVAVPRAILASDVQASSPMQNTLQS